MNMTVLGQRLNARGAFMVVIIFAALLSRVFGTDSAAYAQTESSAAGGAPVLTAVSTGRDAAALSWNSVPSAVGYELWTWEKVNGWLRLDDGTELGTRFTHSGLTPGKTYFYAVRAVTAEGEIGDWSEYAEVTVSESQGVITAPVLTAETGGGKVTLTWNTVSAAVRYELLVWRDLATGWQHLDDGHLTGTSFTHSEPAPGITYYYTVRAVDENGEASEWSEYAKATPFETDSTARTSTPTSSPSSASPLTSTPSPTPTLTPYSEAISPEANMTTPTPTSTESPPEAPTLTAEAVAGQITLTWEEVVGADRYELLVWQDFATGWKRLDEGNLTGTTYAHKGLEEGTTYYYTIRSVDVGGQTSEWSEYAKGAIAEAVEQESTAAPTSTATPTSAATSISGLTQTLTPTPSVSALTSPRLAAEASAGIITLTWVEVIGAVRYELLAWRDLASGWQRLGDGNLAGATFEHRWLAAGTKYYYTVRAFDAHGDSSPWSEYANATVLESSRVPDPAEERAALKALYKSTDGAN